MSSFLQRVRIARNADGCNSQTNSVRPSVCLSVRPSVCPSVTFRCFVQRNEDTIVWFTASHRTIILVSGEVKSIRIFAEDHPLEPQSKVLPCRYGKFFSAITRTRCKIGGKLLLFTNRKSYMSFRLVIKSETLNDTERHNGRVFCVISPNFVDFGAYYVKVLEDKHSASEM